MSTSPAMSPTSPAPVATPAATPAAAPGFNFQQWMSKPQVMIGILGTIVIIVLVVVLTVIFVPKNEDAGNEQCGAAPTDKSNLAWAQCHDSTGKATGTLICNKTTGKYDCYCGVSTSNKSGSTDGLTLLSPTCTTKDASGNTNFTGVPYCGSDNKIACGCNYTSASSFTSSSNADNGWCVGGKGSPVCKTSDSNLMGQFQCTCGSEVATSNACSFYKGSVWSCTAGTSTIDCLCGTNGLRSNFSSLESGGNACTSGPCGDPTSSSNQIALNNAFDSSEVMGGPNGVKTSCDCDCSCSAGDWNCTSTAPS